MEGKRPEREVNHSPPPSDAVRNELSSRRVPPLRLRSADADSFRLHRTDTTVLLLVINQLEAKNLVLQ